MIRETCGSAAGALAHQAAGEPLCGWCSYAEHARRIAAEGIPLRPSPAPWAVPVSAEDAARHAFVLRREVAAFDKDHPDWDWRNNEPRDAVRLGKAGAA